MSLTVRPATPADAPVVHGFVLALAEYEKLSHEVEAVEADIAKALFGPSPRLFCDIAEVAGAPVGFAVWFYSYSTFTGRHGIYLEDLFVRPTARGRGLGKALLAHVASIAVSRGCPRFEWAVLDWNTPALDFYAAMGAKPMSEWTVHRVTGDALQKLARSCE